MAQTKEATKAKFLEVAVAANSGVLTFKFGNGSKVTFDPAKVSDEIRRQAMLHGFNQKIRDAAAGYSKELDYFGAQEEMLKVVEALESGQWNRQGGGAGAGVVMEDLAHAIARIKDESYDRALAAVKKATPEQRTSWSKNGKVAQFMAEAKVARLAKLAAASTEDIEVSFDDDETSE